MHRLPLDEIAAPAIVGRRERAERELLKRAVGLPPSRVLRDTFPSFFCATVMLLIVLAVRVYVLTDYSRLLSIIILVPLGAIVYVSTFVVLFPREP